MLIRTVATAAVAARLPRLLLWRPQSSVSNIGRKPRHPEWLAAAGISRCSASAAALPSNSGGDTGSSGNLAADTQQQQHQAPQPVGTFHVTAKELSGKGGSGNSSKVRLDAYLAAQLPDASRAKISASIKAGLISINRAVVAKPSYTVKAGDSITAALLPPEPCTAIPEAIPLDVVYEDDHLIVVNKAPGMVVHLSPGHTTGTLVNALLAHCGLPACDAVPSGGSSSSTSSSGRGGGLFSANQNSGFVLGGMLAEDDLDEAEEEDDEAGPVTTPFDKQQQQLSSGMPAAAGAVGAGAASSNTSTKTSSSSSSSGGGSTNTKGIIRPGIVHRLDRGTSGLMVVAKTDAAHAALCQQFKERSVSRIYNSITIGAPSPAAARVATNIVRDPGNRLRMMAVAYGSGRGRTAASNYQTLEVVAAGGAAVVQWKLETGRTHQIRVHAKHVGHPLLGDDVYGPNHAASSRQVIGKRSSLAAAAKAAVEGFGRPALHAKTLGFTHPVTRHRMEFDSEWPADFLQLYRTLQAWQ